MGFGFGLLVLNGIVGNIIVGILGGLAAGVGCLLWFIKLEKF